MRTAWILGGALALGVAANAFGQGSAILDGSDVRVVSSFVAPGELIPAVCQEEARVLAQNLASYPRPASWHWVLVCDEAGWARFLRVTGQQARGEIYASTDLESSTTYVRGAKLLHLQDPGADSNTVIAHELAHIRLNTSDEFAADALTRSWKRPYCSRKMGISLGEGVGK